MIGCALELLLRYYFHWHCYYLLIFVVCCRQLGGLYWVANAKFCTSVRAKPGNIRTISPLGEYNYIILSQLHTQEVKTKAKNISKKWLSTVLLPLKCVQSCLKLPAYYKSKIIYHIMHSVVVNTLTCLKIFKC